MLHWGSGSAIITRLDSIQYNCIPAEWEIILYTHYLTIFYRRSRFLVNVVQGALSDILLIAVVGTVTWIAFIHLFPYVLAFCCSQTSVEGKSKSTRTSVMSHRYAHWEW